MTIGTYVETPCLSPDHAGEETLQNLDAVYAGYGHPCSGYRLKNNAQRCRFVIAGTY